MVENNSCDIVLCALALHYIEDWTFTIKEFRRVLKDKGILVISIEHPFNDYNFFKSKKFNGLNVTIPYKQEVIQYIDFCSNVVKETNSVNTIINKAGFLYGYNTDYSGLEFLLNYYEISIKIVEDMKEAIDHINTYSSQHTDTIVTENFTKARAFLRAVDSSSVMINASTRFADGFEVLYFFYRRVSIVRNFVECDT